MTWRSVSVVDNDATPHALQQRYIPEQQPAKDPSERSLVPTDEHRLVPITELDGVEAKDL